jgi:hypothetical protein
VQLKVETADKPSATEPKPNEFNHGCTQINTDSDRTEKMESEHKGHVRQRENPGKHEGIWRIALQMDADENSFKGISSALTVPTAGSCRTRNANRRGRQLAAREGACAPRCSRG